MISMKPGWRTGSCPGVCFVISKVTGLNRHHNRYTQTLACPVQNNLVWSETDAIKLSGTVKKWRVVLKNLKGE